MLQTPTELQVVERKDYRVAMHDLRKDGLVPGSMAYALSNTNPRQTFMRQFSTGDGASPNGKGDQLIVLDARDLWNLNSDSKLERSVLQLDSEKWEELRCKDNVLYIPKKRVNEIHDNGYVKEGGRYVPANDSVEEVWKFLTRGEVDVDDYAQSVSRGREKVMNILFDTKSYDSPVMRQWVAWVGSHNFDAYGNGYLNNSARLLVERSKSAEGARANSSQ